MRLRKDLLVLECDCCNELMVVTHEEFIELFKNDEISTELEEALADILDEILDDGCASCEFDCEECEF